MRTNEDFRNEVLSRAQIYNRKRKKLIRSVSITLPLLVCIILSGIIAAKIYLPEQYSNDMANSADINNNIGHIADDGSQSPGDPTEGNIAQTAKTKVSVSLYPTGEDSFVSSEDGTTVTAFENSLSDAINSAEEIIPANSINSVDDGGYVIVFEDERNISNQYILVNNYLLFENTAYRITDDNASALELLIAKIIK